MTTKKVKRFQNDLDQEILDSGAQAADSNEALLSVLSESTDPNVVELCRRFAHAIECLAVPQEYAQKDVEKFLNGQSHRLHALVRVEVEKRIQELNLDKDDANLVRNAASVVMSRKVS